MIDIVRRRKWFYLFTAILMIGSVIALVAPPRLPFGLEFTSGSALTVDFLDEVDTDEVRSRIEAIPGFEESVIQRTGENSFFIRTGFVERSLTEDLEGRFGVVEITGYEGATAIATTVTFLNPVPERALRDTFGDDEPEDLLLMRAGTKGFFVLSRDLKRDLLDEVVLSWTEEFGEAEITRFDEEGDLVETVIFETPVTAAEINALVNQLGLPEIVIIQAEDDVFVAAKSYPDDSRQALFEGMEQQFGVPELLPFDYSTGQVVTLRFRDALEPVQVAEGIGFSIVSDLLGDQGVLTISSDGSVLLRADDLTNAGLENLIEAIEDELGAVEQDLFNSEDDLAVTLDFGLAVDIRDFQTTVDRLVAETLRVEPAGDNAFYVAAESLSPGGREALQAGLELQFGPARRVAFDPANGLGAVLRFSETPALTDIILRAEELGLPEVLVTYLEGDRVLIASLGIEPEFGEQVLNGLSETFGIPLERSDIDPETGILELFDYGAAMSPEAFAAVVSEVTEQAISTMGEEGTTRFFAFGRDVPEETRNELFAELESGFGVFENTPFDFTGAKLLSISFGDPAQVEQAVEDLLTLEKVDPGQFFIAGTNITTGQRDFLLRSLSGLYGDLRFEPYDFNSNVAMNLTFEQSVTRAQLGAFLDLFGYRDLVIKRLPNDDLFLRGPRPNDDQRSTIIRALEDLATLDRETLEFSSVDAEIARRSILNTFWAVVAGSVGILLYVWWAFRRIPKSPRFGVAAIAALIHDVAIVLGAFGLMAKFLEVEINSLMIVGILAVIGYSVNNTIVVFDRVRENVTRNVNRAFEVSVNISLNETLSRNLNTSLTTSVAILAVLLFGGPTIRDFMLVLLVGVAAGTYSSLFLAANILVSWEKGEIPRFRIPFLSRRA